MDKIIHRLEKFQNNLENTMLFLNSFTSKGLFNYCVFDSAQDLQNTIKELEGYLLTLVDMGIITKTQQEKAIESGSTKNLIRTLEEKSTGIKL